ncbi:matrix protein [Cardamom vein clearing nucleorhabdovirus 1]|uniref:Matrix protein n=1 Tax=cardamom vein clearing virus TaxID=2849749 RepID=A0A6M6R1Q3_9RHAB|nr:matrix protein [Cardamom vein clearing nucleorhabdovirus 1]QJZ27982.1 matrix protein [Cardamom vein clearing nucleorhabdovirus 1]
MIPSTLSVKGSANMWFNQQKDLTNPGKLWDVVSRLIKMHPEKFHINHNVQREQADANFVPCNDTTREMILDMIGGCIITNNILVATGRSPILALGESYQYTLALGVDASDTGHTTIILVATGRSPILALGESYQYTLALGVDASDTGHTTIIPPLPFLMQGAYKLTGQKTGKIGRKDKKEHYTAGIKMDVYIGHLTDDEYNHHVGNGHKIFPFKIEYPKYFTKSESSESDWTSEQSADEEKDQLNTQQTNQLPGIPQLKRKIRGIMKSKRNVRRRAPAIPTAPSAPTSEDDGPAAPAAAQQN